MSYFLFAVTTKTNSSIISFPEKHNYRQLNSPRMKALKPSVLSLLAALTYAKVLHLQTHIICIHKMFKLVQKRNTN